MRLFKMVFSQTSLKNRSKTVLSLCLLATAAVAVPRQPALGDNVAFSDVDSITTRRVAELILARHFENQPIDDEVSGQLFDSYLKAWDPNRLYFTKSDIDEFTVFRTSLDDQIRSGQLQFAKLVFDRFIVRATESQSVISSAIDQQHDFLIDESVVRKGDSRPWASSAAETKENWRKTIKLQLLNFIIDGDAIDEAKAKLKLRYSTSHNLLVQTDKDEVLELYLTSMMQCLDPHSRYFSPRSEEEFQTNMSLRLTGIGARLRHENGNTVVEEIVKGGAADSDGRLSKEDTIVAVGQGEDGGLIDIVGLKLQAVVDQIRGEVGTVVRLQVEKKGTTKRIVYRMTRQQIELEDQQVSGRIVDSGEWVNGTSRTIGLLTIPSFYRDFRQAAAGSTFRSTARDTKRILQEFRKANVDAVVVDVRNNTGGALAEAIEVTGLFIPTGPVVQMVSRDSSPEAFVDEDEELTWSGPMVVVINRSTASASEIFAAAIKDYRRGLVIGDSSTHGKGSVQNILNISSLVSGPDHGAIKLTVGAWYGITGQSNQIKGVGADIVLPSDTDLDTFGEGSLPNAIANTSTRALKFLAFQDLLSERIIQTVRANSSERIKGNLDFQKTRQRMEYIAKLEQEPTVSLNIDQRRLRQKEAESMLFIDSVDGKEESAERDRDTFAKTFYNKEIVHMTIDYIEELAKG